MHKSSFFPSHDKMFHPYKWLPEKVNIRVPEKLIRAGLKWASFIPKDARHKVNTALSEKGLDIDFNKISSQDIEELLVHLNDLTVDVEGKEKVRIFCE